MIYFVASSNRLRVKIGTTIRLSQRLKQLRSEYGPGLEVVGVTAGSFIEEAVLHRRFAEHRIQREWFFFVPQIEEFIRDHADVWDGVDEVPLVPMSVIRMDAEAYEMATKAASLMKLSLSDYASEVLRKAAEQDILREARKLV